jgi:hypothetical protein
MRAIALLSALVPACAAAQVGAPATGAASCIALADRDQRLNCYDKANRYIDADQPRMVSPLPAIRWQVRNDGRFDSYAGSDIGSKNGEVSVQHHDGENFINANVAVLAALAPINDAGFQPFASIRWLRSEAKAKRSDIREASFGLAIPLGDPFGPSGVGLFLTPRYITRTDIFGKTDSRLFAIHGNIILKSWTSAPEGDMGRNLFWFVPNVGLLHDHRKRPSSGWGDWSSGYAGIELSAQWNKITPRLQTTVKYQYFSDFSQPADTESREGDYLSASISYEFTDPDDASIRIRPAVFLTREVGLNPILSEDRFNATTLGFGLKIN